MRTLFSSILNLGIYDGLSFSEKNKLRVFNPACLFVLLMGIAYTAVGFFIHFSLAAIISFVAVPMSAIGLYLAGIRRYALAFHFMIIFGMLYIEAFVILFGLKLNTYLFFLFIPIACSIFFDVLRITIKYFVATLFMIFFSIWHASRHAPLYINDMLGSDTFSIANALLSATLIFLGVWAFKRENISYSKQLEHTNEVIEEKNKSITDSINYARRIQYTLLAHTEFLKQNLPDHFILFRPKDIVSGDFYWASVSSEKEKSDPNVLNKNTPSTGLKTNNFYLAVCDSTGHGVPGAFMSLLNSSFLNEAVSEKRLTGPHQIFDHVRKRLIDGISQDGGQDGMDGILLRFGPNERMITYAAAHNAPILIRNGEIIEQACDKMPVGKGEKDEPFTLHSISTQPGDMLYLYTDGYADQFGGPKGKKFKYRQLNELLLSLSDQPLTKQKEKLEKNFDDWRGPLEQVDDVCLIGIRL